jgi:hypothetical protein
MNHIADEVLGGRGDDNIELEGTGEDSSSDTEDNRSSAVFGVIL